MITNPSNSIVSTVFFAIAIAAPGHARELKPCSFNVAQPLKWPSPAIGVSVSAVSFPSGSLAESALAEVFDNLWFSVPSNVFFDEVYGDTAVQLGNGENETWFSDTISADGVCYWWWNSNCEFTEFDVLFRPGANYTFSNTKSQVFPYGGSMRPFQNTALHEFGHAQGLAHTGAVYSVMGADFDHIHADATTYSAYAGEDAVADSRKLYGDWDGVSDISVAHWRRSGQSGEYSSHDRTRLFSSTGSELPLLATYPEPIHEISPGQAIQVEATFENLGLPTYTSVPYAIYLSTDSTLSIGDPLLTQATLPVLSNDDPITLNTAATLPPILLSAADYWLFVVMDPQHAITETDEDNNITYLRARAKFIAPPPDVIANSISGPKKSKPGKVHFLTISTSVTGGTANYGLEVRLSKDGILDSSDPLLNLVSSAVPGTTYVAITIPQVPKGKYYFVVSAKPVGNELSSGNNVAFSAKVKIK